MSDPVCAKAGCRNVIKCGSDPVMFCSEKCFNRVYAKGFLAGVCVAAGCALIGFAVGFFSGSKK